MIDTDQKSKFKITHKPDLSDREILTFAAIIMGYTEILCYDRTRNSLRIGNRKKYTIWDPLNKDDHAFRLLVALWKYKESIGKSTTLIWTSFDKKDLCKDTRRTITTLAAHYGLDTLTKIDPVVAYGGITV
jgi:hypothetical protein